MSQFLTSPKRRTARRRSSRVAHKVWPWVLFVLLTAVLAWVRYWPGAVSAQHLSTVILSGIWVLVGMHIVVVLYAFDDDSFHGVLCAILPGYSLYYLFAHADQFYVRSLVAALLIVFGWDTSLAIRKTWVATYYSVSSWIQDTDTLKKDLPH